MLSQSSGVQRDDPSFDSDGLTPQRLLDERPFAYATVLLQLGFL
jgi:hypothetical protein